MSRSAGIMLPALIFGIILIGGCTTTPYSRRIGEFGTAIGRIADAHAIVKQMEQADRENRNEAQVMAGQIGYGSGIPEPCTDLTINLPCRFDPVRENPDLMRPPGSPPRIAGGTALPSQAPPLTPINGSHTSDPDPREVALKPPPPICMEAAVGRQLSQIGGASVGGRLKTDRVVLGSRGPVTEAQIYDAIRNYGDSLQAVADATNRADFDAAADKLASTAGSLASTLGAFTAGAGAAIGPVVTAAVKLGTFATAQNLEHQRYQALRSAMIEACIPLRTLAFAIGLTGEIRRNVRHQINRDTLRIARPVIEGNGPYRIAALRAAHRAADSINTLRTSPIPISEDLIASHDRLVVAVANAEDQEVSVLRSLSSFAGLADDFRRSTQRMD